jgi:hypothetical protein
MFSRFSTASFFRFLACGVLVQNSLKKTKKQPENRLKTYVLGPKTRF